MGSFNGTKFRNESNAFYTRALIYEWQDTGLDYVLYTLKNFEHKGYPSLYQLYMDENDPLEYTFANKYFEGWEHWEVMCNSTWFKPYIQRWRHELELKIRTEALLRVQIDAKAGSKTSASSNKFLLSRGWDLDGRSTKGRPSKADIRKAAIEKAQDQNITDTDFLRITSVQSAIGIPGNPNVKVQ